VSGGGPASGFGQAAPWWVLAPRVALMAGTGCAAVAVAWFALDIGWLIGAVVVAAAVLVAVLAVISTVRFRSRLVAPAALAVVLLVNPITLTALAGLFA
jgi:hypothetical protein